MVEKILMDTSDERWTEWFQIDEELELLFNDSESGNEYVVYGDARRWDSYMGNKYIYCDPNIYDSIYDAIKGTLNNYDDLTIIRGNYGRLKVVGHHHDSHCGDSLEIRQLTKRGHEMDQNWKPMIDIIRCKNTTKNAGYYG